ncbi:hypothetical protein ACP4OV_021935 [Aristida adscensionis]
MPSRSSVCAGRRRRVRDFGCLASFSCAGRARYLAAKLDRIRCSSLATNLDEEEVDPDG